MAKEKKLSLPELFEKFVELRISGTNRDEAWGIVTAIGDYLTREQVNRLLQAAKDWERREGYQYHHHNEKQGDADNPSATILKPLKPRIQHLPDSPAKAEAQARVAQSQGLTGNLDPAKLRNLEQRQLESVLDQEPPANNNGNAGFNASFKRMETSQIKPPEDTPMDPTYFGAGYRLLLYFRGYPHPMDIIFRENKEMIIGRSTENRDMAPDIDLGKVNGQEFGVSRMHAAMMLQNEKILVTDLGSVNETSINGQRLHPQEIRVLKDYDEIWFAQLTCRVRFHRG